MKQLPTSLALVTLLPTIFSFLTIIFIQLGGVPIPYEGENHEGGVGGASLALVKWDYTITPISQRTTPNHSVHVYLNRICALDTCLPTTTISSSNTNCKPKTRCETLQNGLAGSWHPSAPLTQNLVEYLIEPASPAFSPFKFEKLDLAVTYTFYILTTVLLLPLGGLPFYIPVHARKTRHSKKLMVYLRKLRKYGLIFSGFATLSFLVASLVITVQSHILYNSIVKNTVASRTFDASIVSQYWLPDDWDRKGEITYNTTLGNATVGMLVMGLTWSAFVLMGLESVIWLFLWKKSVVPVEEEGEEMK